MKITLLLGAMALAGSLLVLRGADAGPSAFDKALYERARYEVVSRLNDDDFVSYCVTMNVGGETLLKIHDDILVKETELAKLLKEGMTNDHPEVIAVNNDLRDLRSQLAVKIFEARKGLEVESKVAEATLAAWAQYQK